MVGVTVLRIRNICWGWWLAGLEALSLLLDGAGTHVLAMAGGGQGPAHPAKPDSEPVQGDAVPLTRVLPAGSGLPFHPSPPAWLLPSLSAQRRETPNSDVMSLFLLAGKSINTAEPEVQN